MYGDSVDNTAEQNSSVFFLIRIRWLQSARASGSKTLHRQNPPVLNWRCQLTQIDLNNGCKTVIVVVVYYTCTDYSDTVKRTLPGHFT